MVLDALPQLASEAKRICDGIINTENAMIGAESGHDSDNRIVATDKSYATWAGVGACTFNLILFARHPHRQKEAIALFAQTSAIINLSFNGVISLDIQSPLGFHPASCGEDAVKKHFIRTRNYPNDFPDGYLNELAIKLAVIGYSGALIHCVGNVERIQRMIEGCQRRGVFEANALATANFADRCFRS